VERGTPGSAPHADALLRRSDAEVAVIGSSVALLDIRPQLLADELGVEVVDVGILGAPVAVTAMRSRALIGTEVRRFVLVVAGADLATEVPARRIRSYDPEVALELFGWRGLLAERDVHLDRLLGWVSVAWRQRHLPRKLFFAEPGIHPRDRRSTEGRGELLRRARERHRALEWTETSANARGLVRLATRLHEAGRELIVVPAPQDPRVSGDAVDHALIGLLAALEARAPFRLVVPSGWPVWKSKHFRDPIHLAPEGQRLFTRGLATELQEPR